MSRKTSTFASIPAGGRRAPPCPGPWRGRFLPLWQRPGRIPNSPASFAAQAGRGRMTRTQTRLINPNFRLQEVAGFQRKLGPDLLGQDHPASFVHRDCDHGIKNGIWYSLSQGLPARVKKSKLTLKSGSPCPGANAGVESCRDRKNGSATNGAKFRAVWDAALAGQIVVFPRDPWVAPQPRARGLHGSSGNLMADVGEGESKKRG